MMRLTCKEHQWLENGLCVCSRDAAGEGEEGQRRMELRRPSRWLYSNPGERQFWHELRVRL